MNFKDIKDKKAAITLAHAFLAAHRHDDVYTALRFHLRMTSRNLTGYLIGAHSEVSDPSDFDNIDLDAVQDDAAKFLGEGKVANPGDRNDGRLNTFVIGFSCGAWLVEKVIAYATCLETAIEECGQWVVENRPGLLCDDQVNDNYERLVVEENDLDSEHDAQWEAATVDTIPLDGGHYLTASEVHLIAENPTRQQLAEIFGVKE